MAKDDAHREALRAALRRHRYKVVDQFDASGRHYIVALEDEPDRSLAALTERERQIVGALVQYETTKAVAYELAVSDSTVRVLLARAIKRLGLRTRHELLALYRAAVAAASG
jgi:DNA-binding NarL/FixJ family response regulator